MAFRKAVYAELAPELKQSLWREHLTSFLGEGSLLTATQQAIVRLVLTNLDRYIVDDRARGRAALEADGWTQKRLAAEFGDLATAMFSTLGPADDADDDLQMPYCSCSTESDYCSGECNSSNVECKVTGGCGTLWCHECDGLCYDPDPV